MDLFERITTGLLDLTEDRRYAWFFAAAGLLVTAACWYVALGPPELVDTLLGSPAFGDDGFQRRPPRLAQFLVLVITVGAPFIAIQAASSAVASDDAGATAADSDPAFGFLARSRADRQRRVRLVAAMAGVLNLIMLFLASQ
jgi:hypothetical protein